MIGIAVALQAVEEASSNSSRSAGQKGDWNSCSSTSSRGSRCITRLDFGHRKLLYECNASTASHCLGKLLVSPIDSTRSQTMLTQRPQWLAACEVFIHLKPYFSVRFISATKSRQRKLTHRKTTPLFPKSLTSCHRKLCHKYQTARTDLTHDIEVEQQEKI